MKKILFIISTDDKDQIYFAKELSEKLKKKGADTMFFFMSRGVLVAKYFDGEKSSLCSRNAEEFKIKQEDLSSVNFASQYELSRMVEEADVVIPFI